MRELPNWVFAAVGSRVPFSRTFLKCSKFVTHLLVVASVMACAPVQRSAPEPSTFLSEDYETAFSPIRQRMADAVRNEDVASLAVGVAVDGRIVWTEAVGFADRARQRPATVETIYPIASLSKPITATGIMIFVDRGRLSLDHRVNHLLMSTKLHSVGADADQVSVRDLLQHRGGLPTHGRYYFENELPEPPLVSQTIDRFGLVTSRPADRYQYSNLGFGILAYLTAELSARPYPEFMRDELFRPLGMHHTSIQIERSATIEAATQHDADGHSMPYYRFDEWGSGRVYSTVGDLLRFGLFQLGELKPSKPVLRDRTRRMLVEDRRSTGTAGGRFGPDWFYALGWGGRERTQFSPYWYGHDGAMPGTSADLKLLPDQRAVIVVLSNSRSELPAEITAAIMEALVPDYRLARKRDPAFAPTEPTKSALPTELDGTWEGVLSAWNGTFPIRLHIAADGTSSVSINGASAQHLENVSLTARQVKGKARAVVPLPEAAAVDHDAVLDLELRGGSLVGTVHAYGKPPLYRIILPTWAELRRVSAR